jgi:hypothetical protein
MIELQAFTTYFKRCTEDEQATIVNGFLIPPFNSTTKQDKTIPPFCNGSVVKEPGRRKTSYSGEDLCDHYLILNKHLFLQNRTMLNCNSRLSRMRTKKKGTNRVSTFPSY